MFRFVFIGGADVHEWFNRAALTFRTTKNLDLVIIVEVMDEDFVEAFRTFVENGGYMTCERFDGTPELSRFSAPTQTDSPFMLELFRRKPEGSGFAQGERSFPSALQKRQRSCPPSFSRTTTTAHSRSTRAREPAPCPALRLQADR